MTSEATNRSAQSPLRRAAAVTVLLAASALAVIAYVGWNEPPIKAPSPPMSEGYDPAPMREAVAVGRVEAHQDRILALGSRSIGQPGHRAARDLVRRAYQEAGLELIEQRINTVAPETIRREILDADGRPLPGVEVYPFLPNQFATVTMDEQGVTGELVLVTDEVLDTRVSFDDCIAVVDPDAPSRLGVDWRNYAKQGFVAMIVAHRGGLEAIEWTQAKLPWVKANVPSTYPRLAGTREVFDHLGRVVTVRVHSRYANPENVNLIGVLYASGDPSAPADEAVVVTCAYDASSWLPDLAMGTAQSVGLATQLALLDGLTAQRERLQRDVIFVATGARAAGQSGVHRLLSVLGDAAKMHEAREHYAETLAGEQEILEDVRAILACFDDERFFVDGEASEAALEAMSKRRQEFADEQIRYVLNTLLLELKEPHLQARLDFLRADENIKSPEYERFLEAAARYDDVLMVLGYRVGKLVDQAADVAAAYDLRGRCRNRFQQLEAHHVEQVSRARTAVAVNERFARYRGLTFFTTHLAPASSGASAAEEASLYLGKAQTFRLDYHPTLGPPINDLLAEAASRAPTGENFRYVTLMNRHMTAMESATDYTPFDSSIWVAAGYPAFALVNTNRLDAYQHFYCPVDAPAMRELSSLASSLQVVGETMLSLAYGNGRFESTRMIGGKHYAGYVYLSGLGRSIVPNYPLADAMVGLKAFSYYNNRGRFEQPFLWTDPYGRYDLPFAFANRQFLPQSQESAQGYSPLAVAHDELGRILYVRDESPAGQKAYRSMGLDWTRDTARANIVVFRATPVSVLDMVNPQTLKAYTDMSLIDSEGLTDLKKFAFFTGDAVMRFVEPDQKVFVTFKAGSPENELARMTRAFMLNIDDAWEPDPLSRREIEGPGYLAADAELLLDVPVQVARSMEHVNGKRLALQNRHAMADERTNTFHEKAADLLDQAQEPGLTKKREILRARDAVTYHTLNHPVLRESISEAVLSILWYLCLLVPFTFFFEKLLFAFPDVRKQLAAHGVIFIVAFALLKLLHPAFEMIRSSLMILLGFVIVLISTGITLLFSGKFQENLEGLRAKRGAVVSADVNMMGVVGTAFMLGLNNMHRRMVRTGLTCATLALITFAMICFTTTQSDLVDSEVAVGRAPYQGLLIKDEKIKPIEEDEFLAWRTKYGDRFPVAERRMVVARGSATGQAFLPDVTVEHVRDGRSQSAPALSVMTFEAHDPLATEVEFLTEAGWFEADSGDEKLSAVMLPSTLAEQLGVTPEAVDAGDVTVTMNGRAYRVHSIFTPDSLRRIRDLDGKDILPFEAQSMRDTQKDPQQRFYANEPYERIDPTSIVITDDIDGLYLGEQVRWRRSSLVVWLKDRETGEPLPYKEARGIVDSYLEQTGVAAHYGLGGVAYQGKRTRERNIAGLLDMLIPLIIAAMTVLNTIRGSVYERRSEIYVYNAVGIAPRYVFFMFFAEAFVYAVVGTVIGYFLSQGTGRILTELGWTGGLNMTFTSFSTILASLAIMAAVFGSTLFPAISAMRIAAPAEESGWEAPDPEGDLLEMMLPFTFNPRDRLAVLEFFNRFFLDHGEGSSGAFFCDDPVMGVADETDPLAADGYVPQLSVTVWLKPYDLGVSQALAIALPTDPQTHEYIARLSLTRLSGTHASWTRLNRRFLVAVRRHFLHWRAVGPDQRAEMFAEAREHIESQLITEGAVDAS